LYDGSPRYNGKHAASATNCDPIDAQSIERYAMNIKPIRTEMGYRATLKEIEFLMTAKTNTPEGDRLDVLATLVEAYERTHSYRARYSASITRALPLPSSAIS
jgi:antitoxin component HigA of HigAB toxin-antitoxin module